MVMLPFIFVLFLRYRVNGNGQCGPCYCPFRRLSTTFPSFLQWFQVSSTDLSARHKWKRPIEVSNVLRSLTVQLIFSPSKENYVLLTCSLVLFARS